jgi:hypothetical protein
MNSQFDVHGFPGAYHKLTSTDSSAAFPAALLTRNDGAKPIAVSIVCETNNVRVTWDGTTPTTTGTGMPFYAGGSLRLSNRVSIANFKFISMTAGSAGVLHVTPEYDSAIGTIA